MINPVSTFKGSETNKETNLHDSSVQSCTFPFLRDDEEEEESRFGLLDKDEESRNELGGVTGGEGNPLSLPSTEHGMGTGRAGSGPVGGFRLGGSAFCFERGRLEFEHEVEDDEDEEEELEAMEGWRLGGNGGKGAAGGLYLGGGRPWRFGFGPPVAVNEEVRLLRTARAGDAGTGTGTGKMELPTLVRRVPNSYTIRDGEVAGVKHFVKCWHGIGQTVSPLNIL